MGWAIFIWLSGVAFGLSVARVAWLVRNHPGSPWQRRELWSSDRLHREFGKIKLHGRGKRPVRF